MSIENPQAFIFPGQGTQRVGMAEPLFSHRNPDISALVERTFEEANDIMQTDLKSLVLNGPNEQLDNPIFTESAILVTSIAALRLLGYYDLYPDVVAGHSMGEHSALVAAESLSFSQALSLVKSRGEFMQRAKDELPKKMGMAAVLGLTLEEVEDICQITGAEVANINSEKQIVISGIEDSIINSIRVLGERKVKRIKVNIASHSSLLENMSRRMEFILDDIAINDPKVPFIQNSTAEYARTAAEVRRGLKDQITGRVLWLDSVMLMKSDGVKDYVEVGPGKVLSNLIKRIDPRATTRHYEEFLT